MWCTVVEYRERKICGREGLVVVGSGGGGFLEVLLFFVFVLITGKSVIMPHPNEISRTQATWILKSGVDWLLSGATSHLFYFNKEAMSLGRR